MMCVNVTPATGNGENKMNEYEEEILEQRAQDWDYEVEDAQEM
ncbi:hypothetical protein SAMN05216198_1140 [Halopseudomonas litoralis]|uniref:Uncharacterized protein n=1 Tax=Halopseudomonas litoralis TaxID=797277 RepID=A0A1H1PB60_9GAMM|nr:hypothetical protein [Halopseudomonas litoralis]SDS08491.1 hypothetical protein SAMN05216198_1140 [Halopseudomonas litoralis]